jgi:hypothetical protein
MPKRLTLQRVASQFIATVVPEGRGPMAAESTTYNGWQELENDLLGTGVSLADVNYNVLFAEKDGTRSASQIMAFEDTWEWNRESSHAYEQIVEGGGRAV